VGCVIIEKLPAQEAEGRSGQLLDLGAAFPLYHERLVTFPQTWRAINPPAADRHLADLVLAWVGGAELPPPVVAWLRRPAVRGFLFLAYVRGRAEPWSATLARAYEGLA